MHKRIDVRWSGNLDFTATSEEGVSVAMGGEASAGTFRPATLVLAGLAGCTAMDAISILRKKRVDVTHYRVEAVGTQRQDHPRSFTSIVVEHIVEGHAIDDVAVARAIELSARKYCIVGANLASGDTAINHRFRVTDEAGERTCDCLTIGPKGRGLSHYEDAPPLEVRGETASGPCEALAGGERR